MLEPLGNIRIGRFTSSGKEMAHAARLLRRNVVTQHTIKHYKTQKYSLIYIHMYTYTYMYTYIRIYTCTYYRHRDMDLGMKLRMYVRTYFSLCPCSMDACTVRDACTFCNV